MSDAKPLDPHPWHGPRSISRASSARYPDYIFDPRPEYEQDESSYLRMNVPTEEEN